MSRPDVTEADIALVLSTLKTGTLSIGPQVAEFERRFAASIGVPCAAGVSSGTAALHLAMIAAGVDDDDVVVTTPFSFVASANCVLYQRAVPVFVDVDPRTGNIDPALAADAVVDLTGEHASRRLPRRPLRRGRRGALRAVLPVHAFGQPADVDPLTAVVRDHGLALIEDACEALGAEYKGRRVGTLGDAATFAFYPNKQMTTGEGGMIVTLHREWDQLFRSLRNQGRDVFDGWLTHTRLGYNYRLDELSAALGVSQLSRIDELLAKRARVADWYDEGLSNEEHVRRPWIAPTTTRMSWFVYVIQLSQSLDRRAVMASLEARGVPTRPYFTPIHLQPFYVERFGYRRGQFPVAELLGDTCLALPFSGSMTEAEVAHVCVQLHDVVQAQQTRERIVLSQRA